MPTFYYNNTGKKSRKGSGEYRYTFTHKQASKLNEINYRIAFVLCLLFYIIPAHEFTEFHFIFWGNEMLNNNNNKNVK